MNNRPALTKNLSNDKFIEYYYLKEELVEFCREEGLATSGGKQDVTFRISNYLKTGERLKPTASRLGKAKYKASVNTDELTVESIIEEGFVCSEKHRAFFKSVIGEKFSFNVVFQKYLKSHAGCKYSEAVDEWYKIQEDKKNNKGKSKIDSQFEYNTYIRDFFKCNEGKSLDEAIKCWKYKKSLSGHNKYEKEDLLILA